MRKKAAEQRLAQLLRAQGLSVRRIANDLDVALSSVSVWVRDVPVPTAAGETDPPTREMQSPPSAGEREVRRCSRCEQVLPLASFNRAGEGRQYWCRDCFRTYFAARGQLHRDQVRVARRQRVLRAREHVARLLQCATCADCGLRDPLVLEWDHCRGTKESNLSELIAEGASLKRIDRELARCEVVCACCHRRRTAVRGGWYRVTGIPRPTWTRGQRRNHRLLLERLGCSSCVDCGERDPVVLEFDHVDSKKAEVTTLAAWCSIEVLEREIGKCVIRCVNCHRRRSLRSVAAWRTTA